jgi:hypothetical protein
MGLCLPEKRKVDLQNVSTGLNDLKNSVGLLNFLIPRKRKQKLQIFYSPAAGIVTLF